MSKLAYRHGDLTLIQIDELPLGLKETATKVLMTGSNNNPHSFDNGKVYFKNVDAFVFGYFVAENTTLKHPDHGKRVKGKKLRKAKIKNGIYELRNQVEATHRGMIKVID